LEVEVKMSERCPDERIESNGRVCLNHHREICPFPVDEERYCLRYQELVKRREVNKTRLDVYGSAIFDFRGIEE